MKKRVLLVDDEPTSIALIKPFLEAHDYAVDSTDDGSTALDMIVKKTPHAIILDVQMPKMNGYTFVQELKKKGYQLPIIIVTAKSGMAEIFKVEGVKDYLVKPVRPQELLEKIKLLIG